MRPLCFEQNTAARKCLSRSFRCFLAAPFNSDVRGKRKSKHMLKLGVGFSVFVCNSISRLSWMWNGELVLQPYCPPCVCSCLTTYENFRTAERTDVISVIKQIYYSCLAQSGAWINMRHVDWKHTSHHTSVPQGPTDLRVSLRSKSDSYLISVQYWYTIHKVKEITKAYIYMSIHTQIH